MGGLSLIALCLMICGEYASPCLESGIGDGDGAGSIVLCYDRVACSIFWSCSRPRWHGQPLLSSPQSRIPSLGPPRHVFGSDLAILSPLVALAAFLQSPVSGCVDLLCYLCFGGPGLPSTWRHYLPPPRHPCACSVCGRLEACVPRRLHPPDYPRQDLCCAGPRISKRRSPCSCRFPCREPD